MSEKSKKTQKKNAPVDEKSTAIAKKKKTVEVDIVAEQKKLAGLKAEIHKLSDDFIQVVVDLHIIKKEELWKYEFDNDGHQKYEIFEDFMDAEFGFKRAYFSRLNAAYMGYTWLKKQDKQLQPESSPRPLFYETLYRIPKDKRLAVMQKFVEDKQPLTAAALTHTQETIFGSQDQSATPEEIGKRKLKKTIEIILGILNGINLENLKNLSLDIPSSLDEDKIKSVIEYLNSKIGKAKKSK